jgi:nucleotide-binding universal stress UspA family protein
MTNINLIKEAPGGVKVNINKADLPRANEIFEDFRKAYGYKKQDAVEYMRSIRRILVPVDFSYHAENAAVYALQLAAQFKADIKLVNAYLDPLGSPSSYLESFAYHLNLDEIISEVEMETEMSLESLSLRLKKLIKQRSIKGVNISYELYKGNSVDVILNYAEEFKAGLIIMGTRGAELEGLKSLGSITAEILSKAQIPVVAIPKGYDAWEFNPPKRILYATNFDNTDYSALRKLVSLVKPFDAKIYCVHASLNKDDSLSEMQMRKIKNYMFDTMDSYKLECGVLNTSDLHQGMQIFIDQNDIDLIAVTHHKRSFLFRLFEPSIAKKFLFQTKIPLLVFHARPLSF